jgi:hypothetical protein
VNQTKLWTTAFEDFVRKHSNDTLAFPSFGFEDVDPTDVVCETGNCIWNGSDDLSLRTSCQFNYTVPYTIQLVGQLTCFSSPGHFDPPVCGRNESTGGNKNERITAIQSKATEPNLTDMTQKLNPIVATVDVLQVNRPDFGRPVGTASYIHCSIRLCQPFSRVFTSSGKSQRAISTLFEPPDPVARDLSRSPVFGPAIESFIYGIQFSNSTGTPLTRLYTDLPESGTGLIISALNEKWRRASLGVYGGMETLHYQQVSVRWAWFSVPLIVWAASLVFFLSTVIESKLLKLPTIWKTSILAPLFGGLSSNEMAFLCPPATQRNMRSDAKDLKVQLMFTREGNAVNEERTAEP